MIFVLASGYLENFYKNFDKDNFNVLYIHILKYMNVRYAI